MKAIAALSVLTCAILLSATGCATKPKDPLLDDNKARVEQNLPFFASQVRQLRPNTTSALRMLKDYLRAHPEVYGAAFAPAPGRPGELPKFCPYVYRKNGQFVEENLAKPGYDYANAEWFTKPRKKKKPVWSEPYFDEGGGEIWMITYSVPIYLDLGDTEFYGVVTSDLPVTPKR